MSYARVLPRDAFNEAKLLKCIGKLTLLIENCVAPSWAYEYDGEPFDIRQDPSDGSIYVSNVRFTFKGEPVTVSTPLNSRADWPLQTADLEEIFTEQGELVAR